MAKPVPAATVFRDPVHVLAFGFGAGLTPVAPGTAGTLVAIPLELALRQLGLPLMALALVPLFALGVWICGESAKRLGEHDHPGIVFDEFVGYFLTMLAAPSGWPWVVAGFLLFRFFDVLKPFPIRELDHSIAGGLGIMIDDVIAGLFAALALLAARWWLGV